MVVSSAFTVPMLVFQASRVNWTLVRAVVGAALTVLVVTERGSYNIRGWVRLRVRARTRARLSIKVSVSG